MAVRPLASEPVGNGPVIGVLAGGDIEVIGRIEPSSNLALLVEVRCAEGTAAAVYKPERGERPLRDFDPGLHRRERAAFVLSDWLGWDLVPPTVVRPDAPLGVGSLQLYVDADPDEHYFTLYRRSTQSLPELRALAVFDLVANNADRKSGHVLLGTDGRIRAIDNGLCFAAGFTLRTVIWDFAGEPVPEELLTDLEPLVTRVPVRLASLLEPDEVLALQLRVRRLLDAGCFPEDITGRRIPWPLV